MFLDHLSCSFWHSIESNRLWQKKSQLGNKKDPVSLPERVLGVFPGPSSYQPWVPWSDRQQESSCSLPDLMEDSIFLALLVYLLMTSTDMYIAYEENKSNLKSIIFILISQSPVHIGVKFSPLSNVDFKNLT